MAYLSDWIVYVIMRSSTCYSLQSYASQSSSPIFLSKSWPLLMEAHIGELLWIYNRQLSWLNWRSYSLTVFSPSGKLVQIEHALAAVSQGTTSLGIKGTSPLILSPLDPTQRLSRKPLMVL